MGTISNVIVARGRGGGGGGNGIGRGRKVEGALCMVAMDGLTLGGGQSSIYKLCIIKMYTWNVHDPINKDHPNKFNFIYINMKNKKERNKLFLCLNHILRSNFYNLTFTLSK